MSYNITLTNGQNLVNIADGTSDANYTSLTLFGKNYAGYGLLQNENFVKLLENFSFNAPPPNALQGQLWWDSSNKLLKVRRLNDWKVVGNPAASPITPTSDTVGDLWWDTTNNQLNVFNGTDYSIIGPAYTTAQGLSGPVVSNIADTAGNQHTVLAFYIRNQIISILNRDSAFTTNSIPGFLLIKPGYNLIENTQYSGDAENALKLGGILAGNFLRSDVDSTTNNALFVRTNAGLTVGLNNDLTTLIQDDAIKFKSNTIGRHIDFAVNLEGVSTLALRINSNNGLLTVANDPTADLGIATKRYVDTKFTNASDTWLAADGGTPIAGNLSPVVNGVYSVGSNVNKLSTVYSNSFVGSSITVANSSFSSGTISSVPVLDTAITNKLYVDTVTANVTTTTQQLVSTTANAIIGNAPSNMSNIASIAAAVNNTANFGNEVLTQISALAPKNNAELTGAPLAPTQPANDNSNKIATTAFVTNAVNGTLTGNNTVLTGNTTVDMLIVNSGIRTNTNGQITIGATGNRFGTMYATVFDGTASRANYADLAENYTANQQYVPGTIVEFGGDFDIRECNSISSTKVAGVVSTNPAYLMNSACEGKFVVAVALQGRVPAKVVGKIRKGDCLVSAGNGRAKAEEFPRAGTIIGKALADFNGPEGVIEVVVGRC